MLKPERISATVILPLRGGYARTASRWNANRRDDAPPSYTFCDAMYNIYWAGMKILAVNYQRSGEIILDSPRLKRIYFAHTWDSYGIIAGVKREK